MANYKVEIGLDLTSSSLPFLLLDDPVKGILGSTEYFLGGTTFYDITDDIVSFNVNRGKSSQLDRYNAGKASITLNNMDRKYDPLYADGVYFGQIIPRRPIRISVDDERIFTGSIDDWDLAYSLSGLSIAAAIASDNTYLLANQSLGSATQTSQYTGARVNAILTNSQVDWPGDVREIDTGKTLLQADIIDDNTNALQYLQTVAETEPGSFFVNKDGFARFRDRWGYSATEELIFSDDGAGIPYNNVKVIYGSELLYNQITVKQKGGSTVQATDAESQEAYGILSYESNDLLMEQASDAANMAIYLANKYSEPTYRFETLDVQLEKLNATQKEKILALDLGDAVTVKFTPNQVGDPIVRSVEIIKLQHTVTVNTHVIKLGLGTLEGAAWKLSDAIFGKLSVGNALAY